MKTHNRKKTLAIHYAIFPDEIFFGTEPIKNKSKALIFATPLTDMTKSEQRKALKFLRSSIVNNSGTAYELACEIFVLCDQFVKTETASKINNKHKKAPSS